MGLWWYWFPPPNPTLDYFLCQSITNNSLSLSNGEDEGIVLGFRFGQGTEQTLILTRESCVSLATSQFMYSPTKVCAVTLQPAHMPKIPQWPPDVWFSFQELPCFSWLCACWTQSSGPLLPSLGLHFLPRPWLALLQWTAFLSFFSCCFNLRIFSLQPEVSTPRAGRPGPAILHFCFLVYTSFLIPAEAH